MSDFVTEGYYRQICSQQAEIDELKVKLADCQHKLDLFDKLNGEPIAHVNNGRCDFLWNQNLIPSGTPLFLPQREGTIEYWKTKYTELLQRVENDG